MHSELNNIENNITEVINDYNNKIIDNDSDIEELSYVTLNNLFLTSANIEVLKNENKLLQEFVDYLVDIRIKINNSKDMDLLC